jgi:hypothetical protein
MQYLGKGITPQDVVVFEAGMWLQKETSNPDKKGVVTPQALTKQKEMAVGDDRPTDTGPTSESTPGPESEKDEEEVIETLNYGPGEANF